MMADIKAAEDRGDVIDGTPVGASSNPYDYVGVSPVFVKLVALGKPALPAIAAEIVGEFSGRPARVPAGRVGSQISGDTPGSGLTLTLKQRLRVGEAVTCQKRSSLRPTACLNFLVSEV